MRNTYLYENMMFTNKEKHSMVWGGEGKDSKMLIKSLINARFWRGTLRVGYIGIGQSDQKL